MKKITLFSKLNQSGVAHLLVPSLAVVMAGIVGVYYLVASHAAVPVYTNYLTVSTQNVTNILSRANPKNVAGGYIYGPGLNITAKNQVTSFEFVATTPSQGVGLYTTSGGLQANQKLNIPSYINPSKANGVYTGSYVLKYYVTSSQQWFSGPTITYKITLVNTHYTDYVTLSSLTQNITLSKSKDANATGLLLAKGPYITGVQNTSFNIYPNQPTQGVGYYTSSGGLAAGNTDDIQTYINSNKANGVYTGTATVKYTNSSGQLIDGPTLSYTITLTN